MIRRIGPAELGATRPKLERYLAGAVDVPIVDDYRFEARESLPEKATPQQIEMAALALFERDLSRLSPALTVLTHGLSESGEIAGDAVTAGSGPVRGLRRGVTGGRDEVVPPPISSLCQSDAYLCSLAASLAGQNAALTPALLQALGDFKGELLFRVFEKDRKLGYMAEAADAADVLGGYEIADGTRVTGCWKQEEAQLVERALKTMVTRLPGSRGLVKNVVLRTHLGATVNQSGETLSRILGLYIKTRPGEIHLLRERVSSEPESVMRTVYHEAAHELAKNLDLEGSPFGSGEFVTSYARTNRHEDFAETHADLIVHWEKYLSEPQLYLNGTDDLSRKRRWILEFAYGQVVPDPTELGYLIRL